MSGEKSEEPTEERLRQSREKGQVAQRKNVTEAFTLTLATVLVFLLWPLFASGISDIFDVSLNGLNDSLASKKERLIEALFGAFLFGFIITGILAICGLFLHLLLNKFNFAPKSLTPKFEKFNPINGLKGIFSKTTIYNFIRMTVYFTSCATILFTVVKSYLGEIVRASYCGVNCVADVFLQVFMLTLILILAVLIILAALDYQIQNKIFISQSKMTKDEVKREHKGREGDPLIKSKRRQLAMEDAAAPTMREITHVVYSGGFMVALVFQSGRLPYVAMKVKGDGVKRTLSKLRAAGATCVNLPDVAREFYQIGAVGQYMTRACVPGLKKILQAAA